MTDFLAELKRRNVIRMAGLYQVGAWLVLQVASRTSSLGFKGQEALGVPAVADKLAVRHILEGSVRRAGSTLRITAQLIDTQSDRHPWSETYDRPLTAENVFAIQEKIATPRPGAFPAGAAPPQPKRSSATDARGQC